MEESLFSFFVISCSLQQHISYSLCLVGPCLILSSVMWSVGG